MALSAGAQEQFPPFGPDSMRSLTVPAQSMNSTAKQSFPTPSATPSPASSRSATPQPPEPSNFAASHQDIPVGLTHQQQLQFLAQRQVAALSAAAAEPYSRPSSSLSQYMAKRKADYSSEDIRFNRLRISKFTVEPQEEFLMLEIDSNNILRRCRDNYINGTKLLNLTQVTKGQRDSLLRKSIERDVETAGPRWLRGIWVPIEYARAVISGLELNHYFFPLLEADPSQYFDKNILIQDDKSFVLQPLTADELESMAKSQQQLANSLRRSQKRQDEPIGGGQSARKRPKPFTAAGAEFDVNPAAVNSIGSNPAAGAAAQDASRVTKPIYGGGSNKQQYHNQSAMPSSQQANRLKQNPQHPHQHPMINHQQQLLPTQKQQNRLKGATASVNAPISSLCAATRTSFLKQVVEDPILPNIFTSICPCSPQLIATPVDENAPTTLHHHPFAQEGFWEEYGGGSGSGSSVQSEDYRAVDVLMLSQGQVMDLPPLVDHHSNTPNLICCVEEPQSVSSS